MKTPAVVLAFAFACREALCAVPALAPAPAALALQETFERAATAVKPAVVSINTIGHAETEVQVPFEFFFGTPFEEFFRDFEGEGRPPRRRRRRFEGLGSGVVIDPRGYILTNEHVVRSAEKIRVITATRKRRSTRGRSWGRTSRRTWRW